MATSLIWQTSVATSALWAAACLLRRGALADPRIDEAVRAPALHLAENLAARNVQAADFWVQLLPLSATTASHRHRAEIALTKSVGRQEAQRLVSEFSGWIQQVEQAFAAKMPELAAELPLRLEPWRQQWEARGPGLLHSLARTVEPGLLPETVTVILVQPAIGGAGQAFPGANLIVLEALLTDADPRLPEIVRLAWLLTLLNLDLAPYADLLPRVRLHRAAALALIPLVLDAAEPTELTKLDPQTLQLALQSWDVAEQGSAGLLETLDTWYDVFRSSRLSLGTGLKALDEMLGA